MDQAYTVVESVDRGTMLVEILEWKQFGGLVDPSAAVYQQALRTGGLAIRQVRITARQPSNVVLEAAALQMFQGNFTIENRIPVGRIARRVFGAFATGESLFRPTYRGSGTIWLEPSLGHFLLVALENESIIVDQDMFHCCEETVEVS